MNVMYTSTMIYNKFALTKFVLDLNKTLHKFVNDKH